MYVCKTVLKPAVILDREYLERMRLASHGGQWAL
jgi:hypothetical protein